MEGAIQKAFGWVAEYFSVWAGGGRQECRPYERRWMGGGIFLSVANRRTARYADAVPTKKGWMGGGNELISIFSPSKCWMMNISHDVYPSSFFYTGI